MTGHDPVMEEAERIAALRALALLDTPREERFDRITRTAQRILGVPMSLITLVDVDRQWFKSAQGVEFPETPRSASFCAHAIGSDDLMVVADARQDERFVDNPYVTGDPKIRFYAGKPIHSPSGHRMGTLCVIDSVPRRLTADEAAALSDLAAWAELEIAVVAMSRAVEAAERIKDEIISITGHELRSPLTAIRGALGLLAAGVGGELSDGAGPLVDTALRNADRLIRLINDMLDVERLGAGRLPMRREPADLADVARAAAEVLEHAGRGVAIEVHADDATWTVGDRDRLIQVASNLIDNAVKFSPAGAKVTVRAGTDGAHAVLAVRDHGIGMAPGDVARIFDRFTQLDSGADRRGTGSGLGLAIVRALVDTHGGSIAVQSAPGEGSEFVVTLPLTGGP